MVLNQYEPTVKATIEYIRLLTVKVNASTVNNTLQNHPDYPGLLCISDSLNKWNIPNGAGKIDRNKIDELPTPFIAYVNNREIPLAIVTSITDTVIEKRQGDYGKTISENKADFIKNWNGIYLIAEPNEHSGEPDFQRKKRNNLFASILPLATLKIFIVASVFLLYQNINTVEIKSSSIKVGIYLQYFITLLGLFVTGLLLWYEIDKNNPLLQKVCTGVSKGNCEAILTGKAAKVFSWLSWSEVGFFYFAGAMLCFLFANSNLLPAVSLIAAFNILAIPYSFFSIYYQWRVAKQWCVLCLAVQALLVVATFNVLANNLLDSFLAITFSLLIQAALFYLLPALLWFTIKLYILKLQEAKNTKREYLRTKFNTEIFETLLRKQKQINMPTEGLGIEIGNHEATNTLIKICNPYCGPCAKAHPEIEKLLEEVPNLKVRIIFIAPMSNDHPSVKPVRHLMAIASEGNELKTQKALDDWYNAKEKNYDFFEKKYPMNGELKLQNPRIEAMNRWCNSMGIHFTPTIFINDFQLPDAYSITDLRYFLLE